ncbi:MAG: UDP-2,4-diacetamido-2,4,6-trideoxy-beta-L-altropyranose hydrolase [Candidatus Marinimicrobia bacterium]|nr:UDP-2,4-diacetamido-2,4,6-trideoxy-beta-L-altropyranose hydrolase [Candidatus Neomarinimicrobiota bacterium]
MIQNIGLIFDSNFKTGGGHFWRCFNFSKLLQNNKRKFFFISNKLDKNFIRILKKENFKYRQKINFNDFNQIKNLIKKLKLKIIVSDYYHLHAKNKKKIRDLVDKLIVIDDHLNKKHFCDIFINNNFMNNESKLKIKELNPNTNLLLGPDYFIHNKKFLKIKKKIKKKKRIKNIFIFFGTSDLSNETYKFIKSVSRIENINFKILVGNLNKNYKSIVNFCKNKKNMKIFYNLSNYRTLKLMQKTDFAFGSGGINLTERLFLGLPSAVICTAKNQKKALLALKSKGVIHYLGESKNVKEKKIKSCLNLYLENKEKYTHLENKMNIYYKKENFNLLEKSINFEIKEN